MKKVAALLSLIVFSVTLSAQTFSFKEMARLNKLSPEEQSKWLQEEKNYVFAEMDQGDRIYVDSTSELDEFLAVGDSVVTYSWRYKVNSAISENKSTLYLMSTDMDRSLNHSWVEQVKDSTGSVIVDMLVREKYDQVVGVGSEYDTSGHKLGNFAMAIIED